MIKMLKRAMQFEEVQNLSTRETVDKQKQEMVKDIL